jgi:hypothetical protein
MSGHIDIWGLFKLLLAVVVFVLFIVVLPAILDRALTLLHL